MGIVLAKKDKHGLIEDVYISVARLLGGFPLVVQDSSRYVPVLIAPFLDAVA